MKNQTKLFSCFLMLFVLFQSCSSDPCGNDKDDFLNKFDQLVDKVEDIDYDADNENWEAYNQEFKHMIEECYKVHQDDMSSKEERKFWKATTVYYVKSFSGHLNIEDQAAEFGRLIEGNIDEFSSGISETIKNLNLDIDIDEAEVAELFEELGTDIEKMGKKWGKKLEKLLEKE